MAKIVLDMNGDLTLSLALLIALILPISLIDKLNMVTIDNTLPGDKCTMNSIFRSLLAALLGYLFVASTSAQVLPSRPVTLVIPYQAGGGTDLLARLIQPQLEKRLGRTVVIDNRPGADGRIAAQHVVRSKADGTTLLMGSTGLAALTALVRDPGFNPQKDLAPVTLLTEGQIALVTNANAPFSDLKGLVSYAHANPGVLNFATTGIGDPMLYAGMLGSMAGIKIVTIPFKGAEQFNALIRGDVHLTMPIAGRVPTLEKAGQAKGVAVTGDSRNSELPHIPTFKEQGFDGFENFWFAIFAPAGTPKPTIDTLQAAFSDTIKDPALRERIVRLGVQPVGSTPAALAERLDTLSQRWKTAAERFGIKPE